MARLLLEDYAVIVGEVCHLSQLIQFSLGAVWPDSDRVATYKLVTEWFGLRVRRAQGLAAFAAHEWSPRCETPSPERLRV